MFKQEYSEDYKINYVPLQWKKDCSYYHAAIIIPEIGLTNPYDCYRVTVDKTSQGWEIFGIEHEPSEFEQSIFKTLKEAKEYLQDWVLKYTWCELQIATEGF